MNVLCDMFASASLERLGWTLLHSVWQCSFIAVLLSAVLTAIRKRSAEARYLTACIGLVVMTGAGICTYWWLATDRTAESIVTAPMDEGKITGRIEVGDEAVPDRLAEPVSPARRELADNGTSPTLRAEPAVVGDDGTSPGALRTASGALSEHVSACLAPWLPWMSLAWLVGVVLASARHLGGWVGVQRLRWASTTQVNPDVCDRARQLMDRMKIGRPVHILQSTLAEVPVVVGWLRPAVLLPASLLTGLSPRQLEAILAHELAHVRRYDYLFNLLQTAAETLLFYHPAVWWLSRRIRVEREHCCDDIAVSICGDNVEYAAALAAVEERRAAALAMAVGGHGHRGSALKRVRRVLGISDVDTSSWRSAVGGTLAALVPILVVVGYVAIAAEPEEKRAQTVVSSADDGQPQATHHVIQRAKALKSNADRLYLSLRYFGPDEKRYANVHFHSADIRPSLPFRATLIPLSHDQAARIVDVLADHGFLAEATDWAGKEMPVPKGPCYALFIGGSSQVQLFCNLGWSAAMLRRLDALCKALDGDPRKALEILLMRLESQRKAWGVLAPAPVEQLPEHEVKHYRSLYARYRQMTANAIETGDRALLPALTRLFHESVGGELLFASVSRAGPAGKPELLIAKFLGPNKRVLPVVDYGTKDFREPQVTKWHGYVLVETDGFVDDVHVRMAFAVDQGAARCRALHSLYRDLIEDEIEEGDKPAILRMTDEFNEGHDRLLIYAGVARKGADGKPEMLLSKFYGREPFPLPAISYPASVSGTVQATRFNNYVLVDTANPTDSVSIRLVVATNVFAPESESPPQDAGVWSQPLGGLRGRLVVAKPTIGFSEQFRVDLQLRNVSETPISITHGNPADFEACVNDAHRKAVEPTSQRVDVMHSPRTSVIQPKDELTIPVTIQSIDGAKGSHLDTTTRIWTLGVGKYTLTGTYRWPAGQLALPPVELGIREEEHVGEADTSIEVQLRAEKAVWQHDETPVVTADLRNHRTDPDGRYGGSRSLVYHELEVDGKWYNYTVVAKNPKALLVPPGKEVKDALSFPLSSDWARQAKDDSQDRLLHLGPGRHTVRAAVNLYPPAKEARLPAGRMAHRRFVSNPVEIEILPPAHRVAVRTDKEGFPVIAVWREDWGIGTNTDFGPHVITAVWPDGEIVWSQDNLQGGPPYFVGQLDRKTLSKALADLEATGAFTEPCARRSYFAPDSYCISIFLASGTKTLMSRSWHELVERNPKAVAASFGSTALKGQSRDEFLKADKPEYQRYRQLWSEIRAKVKELVPEAGKPLENVEFERRKRSP